jgi:hypothetical protein
MDDEHMTKMILLARQLALAMMTGAASAQQRTFYDASGRNAGTASTDT